jgi:hypothetical protein
VSTVPVAADEERVTPPLLEVGQEVLVAPTPDAPPRRMIVDQVVDGEITLTVHDDGHGVGDDAHDHANDGDSRDRDTQLPQDWNDLREVHLTCLGRFSVYLIRVAVLRGGEKQLIVRPPADEGAVQRRAFARVLSHVPASCTVLDADTNTFVPFDAEVRDLGGGGCSLLTDLTPRSGATVVVSFAIDEDAPFVTVGRVLPRDALPTIGKPLTRVEFVLIRESDRDRILRFVLLSLGQHRRPELRPR